MDGVRVIWNVVGILVTEFGDCMNWTFSSQASGRLSNIINPSSLTCGMLIGLHANTTKRVRMN